VIISTGARWRNINVPGEHEFKNKGVAYCPHCDGPLYKGKRVAVIGGGNSGVEAAIDLAGIVAHVTLVEFDTQLRADEVLQRKLRSLPNVTVIVNAQTTAITGDQKVNGLTYKDRATGERSGRPGRRVRADRPGAQHRMAEGHARAVEARRDRGRCQGADLHPGRVRRRRLHDRAVQADHHRRRRWREGGAGRVRPPDPHTSSTSMFASVVKTMGRTPSSSAVWLICRTAWWALSTVSVNGSRTCRGFISNWASTALPNVSAVMPVPSEMKKTVRVCMVLLLRPCPAARATLPRLQSEPLSGIRLSHPQFFPCTPRQHPKQRQRSCRAACMQHRFQLLELSHVCTFRRDRPGRTV
jgi:hypothetical protein